MNPILSGTYSIYTASAGSGKTFTLTKTYLLLCLQQNEPWFFKHILAITFTNDAAREMKNRVLQSFHDFAHPHKGESSRSNDLKKLLLDELQWSEEKLEQRSKQIFKTMLKDYDELHIRTIDSFTNQLAQTFSLDLNLPFKFNVTFDKKFYVEKAIHEVLGKMGSGQDPFLTKYFLKLSREKLDEGKRWENLVTDLSKSVTETLNDSHVKFFNKNKNLNREDFKDIQKSIQDYFNKVEKQIKTVSQEGIQAIKLANLQLTDFSSGSRGHASNFFLGAEKPNELLLLSKLKNQAKFVESIEAPSKWFTSKNPLAEIHEKLCAFLSQKAEVVFEIFRSESEKYKTLSEINKNLHNLALQDTIIKKYYELLQEDNVTALEEMNKRISEVVSTEPVPYIFERLGENFKHILIDEFQDTSNIQYFNILPLVNNALASNYFNMVVGDAKQSIYSWRGGKVELMIHLMNKEIEELSASFGLNHLQHESLQVLDPFIKTTELDTNYRSKAEIVRFNNELFEDIRSQAANSYVNKAYHKAAQKALESKPGGHVEIEFKPNKQEVNSNTAIKKEEQRAFSLAFVLEKIEKCLSDGYQLGDIAIIARKKAILSMVVEELKLKGYAYTSADAVLLKNNLAINVLNAAVQAINEKNSLFHQHQAIALWMRWKEIPIHDKFNKETTFTEFLIEQKVPIDISLLSRFTLYQLYEYLMQSMGMFDKENLKPYLFTLLDQIKNLPSATYSDWFKFWDLQKGKLAVSAGSSSAITIATIHKTKGLEYPIVIVPEANWSPIVNKDNIWVDTDDLDYPELYTTKGLQLKSSIVANTKRLLETLLAQSKINFDALESLENINLLYVAFTRASHRLYVETNGLGVGKYLVDFVNAQGSIQIEAHTECKYVFSADGSVEPQKKETLTSYSLEKIVSRPFFGTIAQQSKLAFLYEEGSPIQMGNLMHHLLSLLETKDDLHHAISKMEVEGLLNPQNRELVKKQVEQLLSQTEIQPLFAKGNQILNERDIAIPGGKIVRPDRVILNPKETIVVDFKTGKPEKKHEKQVNTYVELFKSMNYPNVKGALLYVDEAKYVEVTS